MEEFAEKIEMEELVKLRGGRVSRTARDERVGGPNQGGRVGRARGERNKPVTTNRTRVAKGGIVETEISGVVDAKREGSQGRLIRNLVRLLGS